MLRLIVQPADSAELEIISALFHSYPIEGEEILESSLLIYLNEEVFFSDDFTESIKEWKVIKSFECNVEKLPNINWNKEWESNFDPVFVDDFLTIKADFHQLTKTTQHLITINPKMSFGTGHHATTWMMTKAMSYIDFKGKKVLDAGSGTGILGILASILGAKEIVAFDSDPLCFTNAEENIAINFISNVKLYEGSLEQVEELEFDIILANINLNFLMENGGNLKYKLKSGAFLLLSGFFFEESKQILDYFLDFNLVAQYLLNKDEWSCIVFKNMD